MEPLNKPIESGFYWLETEPGATPVKCYCYLTFPDWYAMLFSGHSTNCKQIKPTWRFLPFTETPPTFPPPLPPRPLMVCVNMPTTGMKHGYLTVGENAGYSFSHAAHLIKTGVLELVEHGSDPVAIVLINAELAKLREAK